MASSRLCSLHNPTRILMMAAALALYACSAGAAWTQSGQSSGQSSGQEVLHPELAGKTVREDSPVGGELGQKETTYDSTGRAIEIRYTDAKGVVAIEQYNSYWMGQGKVSQTTKFYRPDGTLSYQSVLWFAPNGDVTANEYLHFDASGNQKSGSKWDSQTNVRQEWDPEGGWKDVLPTLDSKNDDKLKEEQREKAQKTSGQGGAVKTSIGAPLIPANLTVVMARDYHPGDVVTVSVMPANEGMAFAGVPGLSVRPFTTLLHSDAAGWSQYAGLRIGAKGNGVAPVVNGLCTFQLPKNKSKQPIELQFLQQDAGEYDPRTMGALRMDDPRDAPPLPVLALSPAARASLWKYQTDRLHNVIEEAAQLRFACEAQVKNAEGKKLTEGEMLGTLILFASYLDALGEMDDIMDTLPANDVNETLDQVEREMREVLFYAPTFQKQGLMTKEDEKDLTRKLHIVEEWHVTPDYPELPGIIPGRQRSLPLWSSPIVMQDKLVALHGPISGDCSKTTVKMGGQAIKPIAVVPGSYYFMPPSNLTAGVQSTEAKCAGLPPTKIDQFFMTQQTGAGQLRLTRGQSTNYWVKLNIGTKPLPSQMFSSAMCQTDLIDAEMMQKKVPNFPMSSNQKGAITMAIFNDTPQVISLADAPSGVLTQTLAATAFDANGSYQHNGTVTAKVAGNWGITAISIANVAPVWALGTIGSEGNAPITGGNTNPVYTPPSTKPAPTREELEERVKIDEDQVKQAEQKYQDAKKAENEAWGKAKAKVPKELTKEFDDASAAWNEAEGREMNAYFDWLESGKNEKYKQKWDAEKVFEKAAWERFEIAQTKLIDAMDAKDREAWQNAKKERLEAGRRLGADLSDLRDAQKALAEFLKAQGIQN
jgi:hypothetical protein